MLHHAQDQMRERTSETGNLERRQQLLGDKEMAVETI